jgi:hypothetical protein
MARKKKKESPIEGYPWGEDNTPWGIALSISCGQLGTEGKEPWHNQVATMGPILFAAGEGRADIAKRVRAWDAHHR